MSVELNSVKLLQVGFGIQQAAYKEFERVKFNNVEVIHAGPMDYWHEEFGRKLNIGMEKVRQIAKVYRKVSLKSQPTDFAYWQSQPYAARLAALEEIRLEYHGWQDHIQPRLQRVYTIVKR